jgi:hypothetical protein
MRLNSRFIAIALFLIGFLAIAGVWTTQINTQINTQKDAQIESPKILIENVRIFNGKSAQLSAPSNILVVGNKIETISTTAIATEGKTTKGLTRNK